ncbi:MAG: hypothetical protein H7Y08_09075 [Rhizobiaceae bacterium]|nr:hypothetical protein [Rhizobiaceae bacterium]
MAKAAGVDRIATFGDSDAADFRLTEFASDGDGARMTATVSGTPVDVRISSPGKHVADTLTAVLGAASLMGADVIATAAALSSWRTGKGRGERSSLAAGATGRITLLDESYNANPVAMRAAISVLSATVPGPDGRRIAVLGDMLELGEQAAEMHAGLADALVKAGVDKVFLAGEAMKALDDALDQTIACEWHETVGELGKSLLRQVRAGDVVTVKASNGVGLARIVDALVAAYPKEAAASPKAVFVSPPVPSIGVPLADPSEAGPSKAIPTPADAGGLATRQET